MKLKITITDDQIKKAIPRQVDGCPIAISLKEEYSGILPFVLMDKIIVRPEDPEEYSGYWVGLLPPIARIFREDLDTLKKKVKKISFDVDFSYVDYVEKVKKNEEADN